MGQLANGMIGYDASYPGGSATAYVPDHLNETAEDWPEFEKISVSQVHACGITAESDLYCWGSYDMGNFGDGNRGDGFDRYSFRSQALYSVYDKPLKVGDSKWKDIAALTANGCGIKDDGTLWCWGNGDWGVLGIGDVYESYEAGTPQDKVTYTAEFQALVDNGDCEIQFISKDEGASQERRYPPVCTKPVQVGTETNWVSVEGMTNHVCAVNSDNELYCWGENEYGQIGNGEHGDVYSTLPSNYDMVTAPTKIDGEFIAVSPGYNFTCAISADKKVYCWGHSALGIPGFIGTKDNPQTTPAKISF
jgi:alpha-tubulin suppressor-like RCC1 family protein